MAAFSDASMYNPVADDYGVSLPETVVYADGDTHRHMDEFCGFPNDEFPVGVDNFDRTAAICHHSEGNWVKGLEYAPYGGVNYGDDDNFLTGAVIAESITMLPKESDVGFDDSFFGAFLGGGDPSVYVAH